MQKFAFLGLFTASLLQTGLAYAAGSGQEEDSVHAWGRWGQMVAPAAGPEIQVTPAALVTPETALELRPEEGQAFGRQVLIPANLDTGGPDTGLPDVSDALPDTPIGTVQPTPAPPPPPTLPGLALDDVTDTSGTTIGTTQPTPAPAPPPGPPAGPPGPI